MKRNFPGIWGLLTGWFFLVLCLSVLFFLTGEVGLAGGRERTQVMLVFSSVADGVLWASMIFGVPCFFLIIINLLIVFDSGKPGMMVDARFSNNYFHKLSDEYLTENGRLARGRVFRFSVALFFILILGAVLGSIAGGIFFEG